MELLLNITENVSAFIINMMMEAETVYETLYYNAVITQLIAPEGFTLSATVKGFFFS